MGFMPKKKDSKTAAAPPKKEPVDLGADDVLPKAVPKAVPAPVPAPVPVASNGPKTSAGHSIPAAYTVRAPAVAAAPAPAPAPVSVIIPPPPVSHASPEALKAAIAGLLEHTPEYLTTLHGMSPEKHAAYVKARSHAHKLVTGK